MKKTYVAPVAEKIKFEYKDQVVAASGQSCTSQWINIGNSNCNESELVKNFMS